MHAREKEDAAAKCLQAQNFSSAIYSKGEMLVAHAASFSHLEEEGRETLLCEFILFISLFTSSG
jgi:hypothetical protein